MIQPKNVVWMWLSILELIQSAVLMLSANDGRSTLCSDIGARGQTLRAAARFFVPNMTAGERWKSMTAWAVVALCVPGAILVLDVIGRMAH